MGGRIIRHADWVHAQYVAWLESGAPDVWMWLVGRSTAGYEYPLSGRERTRILAVRRSLIENSAERDMRH